GTAWNRLQLTMQLASPSMYDTPGEQIGTNWNPAHGDELLAATGHTMDQLVALAEAGKQLPRFPIPAKLKSKTLVKHVQVESQNVAAIYPGSDLKNEYVVMSAHIDHLGIGKPINGDSIFNGAMDDASGVASLLDVAEHLKEAAVKTR